MSCNGRGFSIGKHCEQAGLSFSRKFAVLPSTNTEAFGEDKQEDVLSQVTFANYGSMLPKNTSIELSRRLYRLPGSFAAKASGWSYFPSQSGQST